MVKFKYFKEFDIKIYIYDVSRFMRNVLIATKFINDVFDPYDCTIYLSLIIKYGIKIIETELNFCKN